MEKETLWQMHTEALGMGVESQPSAALPTPPGQWLLEEPVSVLKASIMPVITTEEIQSNRHWLTWENWQFEVIDRSKLVKTLEKVRRGGDLGDERLFRAASL